MLATYPDVIQTEKKFKDKNDSRFTVTINVAGALSSVTKN